MRFIGLLMFALFSLTANANPEYQIITFDGFQAVSTGPLELSASKVIQGVEVETYIHHDKEQDIYFLVMRQLSPSSLGNMSAYESLAKAASGFFLNGRAKLVSSEEIVNNDYETIIVEALSSTDGIDQRFFTATTLADNKFYIWLVLDFPGISKVDGEEIFDYYLEYFKVF